MYEIYQDTRQLNLTIKLSDLQYSHVEEIVPNWNKIKNTFEFNEGEDYPQGQEFQKNNSNLVLFNQKYIPRRINHPHFKNISLYSAQQQLMNRQKGEFIIRPSSKGTDRLNITWKLWDNVIMHLEVKEGNKSENQLISNFLYISKEEYSTLDEIVERYIKPCNQLLEVVSQHRKFKDGDQEYLSSFLQKQKNKDNLSIPYLIGISTLIPQHLHLLYIPKDMEVVTEYIKLKPQGLFFHNQSFTTLSNLI